MELEYDYPDINHLDNEYSAESTRNRFLLCFPTKQRGSKRIAAP